jgi:hypothetical protein
MLLIALQKVLTEMSISQKQLEQLALRCHG